MTGPIEWYVNPDWQKEAMPGIINILQSLGNTMVGEMAEIVPEGTREYEGPRLKDTLYAIVIQSRNARGQWGTQELRVGAWADYALDVEFGHLTVDGGAFVEAQPFIRPVIYKQRGSNQIIAGSGHNFEGSPAIAGGGE